jgi:DNA-binding transcriptional regulator WhiA
MALTADLKDELARVEIGKSAVRAAELATILRFAGGLHMISGKIVIEVELDSSAIARRVSKDLKELYGIESELAVITGSGIRKGNRYQVRVLKQGDTQAVWRGACLAHGSLTDPGRSAALEITAPGNEAAMALVGVARRLGVAAKAREVRGVYRVVIREGEAIAAMLTHIGAHSLMLRWEEMRLRREVRATANRLANFDDANLRRSAQAAVAAGARVERALEILGDEIPDHLKYAGELRLKHKQASLDELGHLSDPPMTKDAIAGRIRRLLALADKTAEERGIPNTEAYLSDDLVE